MKYIYHNDDNQDEGPSIISDECVALVDGIRASFIKHDDDSAYIAAQGFYFTAHSEGEKKERQRAKDEAAEENRQRAEFGQGKAEFRTLDGGVFYDRIKVTHHGYYDRIWKRACRPARQGLMDITKADMHRPIQVRTYELIQMSASGLPVYREIE